MRTLKRIAIVAVAGFGALALAQAQDFTGRLNAARPELDALMQSMNYGEVVMRVAEMFPGGIPDFPQDADPQAAAANLGEMTSILALHDYKQRALFMSGKTEDAIACIKEAEGIAKKNAASMEAGLAPAIQSQKAAMRGAEENIKKATPVKDEVAANIEEQRAKKAQIESLKKKKKADSQKLEAINAELATLESNLASMERDIALWKSNQQTANEGSRQLHGYVNAAKKGANVFAPDLKKMEGALADEKEAIDSKFKGNKAKYVSAKLPGAASIEDQKEKVRFLNRLLFLDPKNGAAKQQLNAALKG
jgi:predicted RNase H-like nuclease (RuvC/YqgF family)